MPRSPTVRRLAASEWRTYRDLRLRSLADVPDAFGRTLEEERARPDPIWASRLAAGADSASDLPLIAELGAEPVGLSWGRIEVSTPEIASLYQMWVAPDHRGLGAGIRLLDTVIEWALSAGAGYVDLGVTCGDSAARRLYARAGFRPAGEPEPLRPGSPLLAQPMRLALLTR